MRTTLYSLVGTARVRRECLTAFTIARLSLRDGRRAAMAVGLSAESVTATPTAALTAKLRTGETLIRRGSYRTWAAADTVGRTELGRFWSMGTIL